VCCKNEWQCNYIGSTRLFFIGDKNVLIYCSVFVCRFRKIYRTQLRFEIQIWDCNTLTQVSIISCAFLFACVCAPPIKISHRTTHCTDFPLSVLLIASSRSQLPHFLKCRFAAAYLPGIAVSNPSGGMDICLLWMRRADPSSREFLPSLCHWVWSGATVTLDT